MFKKALFVPFLLGLLLLTAGIAQSYTIDPFPDVVEDYEFHDSIEFFHTLGCKI